MLRNSGAVVIFRAKGPYVVIGAANMDIAGRPDFPL